MRILFLDSNFCHNHSCRVGTPLLWLIFSVFILSNTNFESDCFINGIFLPELLLNQAPLHLGLLQQMVLSNKIWVLVKMLEAKSSKCDLLSGVHSHVLIHLDREMGCLCESHNQQELFTQASQFSHSCSFSWGPGFAFLSKEFLLRYRLDYIVSSA